MERSCILVGVPVQAGTGRRGCDMGPKAYRAAGLAEALADLGHGVVDRGDLAVTATAVPAHPNPAVRNLAEVAAWTRHLAEIAHAEAAEGLPIFLGGDHSLSAGTMTGLARRAREEGRELFVLWLDAHPDMHTLATTTSGNLHGVPMAYAAGIEDFTPHLPAPPATLKPENVCQIGLRSVDPAEREALRRSGIVVHDMRDVDEIGIAPLVRRFVERVVAADGIVHVSLDVDFLDPAIAPGVGTTVPGGATFREAHLAMEMLHDSGRVRSLDLVELNPFLDERGRTATAMVDLAASLFGRRVLDRPTPSF